MLVARYLKEIINKQLIIYCFFHQMSHSLNRFMALEVKKMHIDARNAGHNGIYIEFCTVKFSQCRY